MKKKIAAIALCVAVGLSCTACKSKEVKNAETLIGKIDKSITLESVDGIEQAEEAYNALGSEQSDVSNVQKLTDARAEYDALYQKEVAPIESAISEIPAENEIPTSDTAASLIGKARALYDKASDSAKEAVSNYGELETAEKVLEDAQVQAAIDAINQIGEVTSASGDLLDAAKAAYQAVPKTRRADITNYSVLTAAQGEYTRIQQEAAEQAKQQALARLTKKPDSVENINWYYPSSYPKYINVRNFVLPYLGERDGTMWIRLVFDYAGNDWIFMDQAIINVDGQVIDTINFDYSDVDRDVWTGAKLSEVADISPSTSQINTLRKIAESNTATIRFKGDKQCDFEISAKDKQGIKDILAVYDAMA